MNEVKRKPGESFDAMLRRFQRRVQTSGLMKEVRRRKVREDVKNPNQRHASKLRGLEMGAKIRYMIKSGKAVEEDFQKKKKGGRR